MNNKKFLKIISCLMVCSIPIIQVIARYLESIHVISSYYYINPTIIFYISIPLLVYIYIKDIINKKRKLDKFDYIFYILVIAGLITTIFSINKTLSIIGRAPRYEGYLTVLSYYLLFINWKVNGSVEDIKEFIKLITLVALLNSFYALMQIYTNFNFIVRYSDIQMASGLCGNPNFFGSLIVTVLSIISCRFLFNKEINIKDYLIIILLFISLINSQSTGPMLTFILVIIFLVIYLKSKKMLILKNLLVLCIALAFIFPSIYVINKYKGNILSNLGGNTKWELSVKEINNTIKTGGNGRLEIWKNSLGIAKDYILVGAGFDNFYLAYPNYYETSNSASYKYVDGKLVKTTPEKYYIIDNAHNVYLHKLIIEGVIGLIPYLYLCLITFIRGLKSKNKYIILLLSGFVAYSIQAFVSISVIQVAPIYYIIMGLILSSSTSKSLT